MVGNVATSGVGMVGNAAGAVGGAVSGTPRAGGGGSWMPMPMGSVNIETRTADEVAPHTLPVKNFQKLQQYPRYMWLTERARLKQTGRSPCPCKSVFQECV